MQINTLVQDIYSLVQRKDNWFTDDVGAVLVQNASRSLQAQYGTGHRGSLRLSQMGPRCPCALWYSVNKPELAEELPSWAKIKYSYGHLVEALAIALAKAAGHEVTGEQDELVVDGVVGHRDCVIDGCLVDVKSSSSMGMEKFRSGSIKTGDTFGYLDQLDGYLVGSSDDPLVRVKDKGYILAVDKTLGHMVLYEHAIRPDRIRSRISLYKDIVARRQPPECTCRSVRDGESGNTKLDLNASYNLFKRCCFPDLRTFLYAEGPRYLTKVVKRPMSHIVEIDRNGKIVYN